MGILIGSSFIGALSDIYGRRRVLLVTLIGTVLSYLLTAYAVLIEHYPLFMFARLITGICEGNISIARALAVDLHPVIDRSRALSLVYATVYGGWLLGPLAGGYLMGYGTDTVFMIAAIATLTTIPIVMLSLGKQRLRTDYEQNFWRAMSNENSYRLLRYKEVRPIFIFYFIYTLGNNAFYEFYPVWLVEHHSFSSEQIGWITVLMTSIMILSSVLLAAPIVKRLGQMRALITSATLMGLTLMIMPHLSIMINYALFMLMGFLIALNNTVTPTYMSEKFAHHGQGKIMGLQTSVFCLSNVLIAPVGSLLAVYSVTLTMMMSGVLILMALIWFIRARHLIEQEVTD